MDSFKFFRKHQKLMIAVTGILAMIAFVFLEPLFGLLGPGGRDNPPVVSTSYGTLREADMQRMMAMRQILNGFLQQSYQMAFQAGGRPTVTPLLRGNARGDVSEEIVLREMLLAKRAEELGFRVSDAAINQYLTDLTGGALSDTQLREMVSGVSLGNGPLTIDILFEALRQAMLANELEKTYVASTAVPPAENWEYFMRLNDRVTIEALPVQVEAYLDQVKEPSDAELQAFFNEHREQLLEPDLRFGVELQSAQPGFRQPPRAKFGFVRADYDQMVDRLSEQVTDEEIAQYYEENKRQYVRPQLLGEDPAPSEPAPEDAEPAAEDTTPKPPEPQEESEAPAEDAGEATPAPETPAEESAPTETPAEPEAPAETQPEAPADEPAEPEAPAENEQSALMLSGTQFVAYQDEDAPAEQPAAEAAEETPAEGEAPAEAPVEQPAEEASAETPAEGETEAPAEQPAAEAAGEAPAEGEAEPAAPEVQYYPLAEVESEIRRHLAQQKAAAEIENQLAPLATEVNAYARKRISWELEQAESEDDSDAEPPAVPDFEAMAKEAGLSYDATPMVSVFELRDLPVGESMVTTTGQLFAYYAFVNRPSLYRPVNTMGQDGSGYLVWKIEEKDGYVPELEEVRDQVVRAWKMIEARKLAEAQAEKLAEQARTKKQSLAELFPDRNVVRTDPFSWLTLGAVPMGDRRPQPRLSQVADLEDVGPAFMQEVFALEDGEVGVAFNHPQTTSYVIRLVNHAASREALQERFLASPGPWMQMAQSQSAQQVVLALNRSLFDEYEVEWQREPDAYRQEQ